MSLVKYKQKRTFSKTPEPQGGKSDQENLRFVIQKHAASHLHYDFRLELKGVLKSWAIPKGPSTDPEVKRLAMMVEDHPFDYRNFEGIIPKGQYGGGTVIVWDEGTYEPVESKGLNKEQMEKELGKQLRSGSLKIRLKGKKLKGEYALVKLKNSEDNSWLLIKHKDRYASATDITQKEKSVLSRKTIEQVAKSSTNIYGETTAGKSKSSKPPLTNKTKNKPSKTKSEPVGRKKKAGDEQLSDHLKHAVKSKFPTMVEPMLTTLVDEPFDKPGWLYEIKWDGYRALALINHGTVDLMSRNNKSFNDKFYPVHDALSGLGSNMIIDGEITVLNTRGQSDFGALQNWRSEADGELYYYAFDIIWYNGYSLVGLPLTDRKKILESVFPANDILRISEAFDVSGIDFFESAKQLGLEGIIAKEASSIYVPGLRSKEWLKIKSNKRQEVVIGGFTRNDDTSKLFSALLAGTYNNGKFEYCGKIGTGFSDKTQREMMAAFKPYISRKSPFDETPDVNKPSRFRAKPPRATVTWLKPKLVCEVSYTELTTDGIMRHPSFEGMRMDKDAKDVKTETEEHTQSIIRSGKKKTPNKLIVPPLKKERKTLLNPTEETQVKKLNGNEIRFTNLNKIYWPDVKVTKRDMLNYYYQVAPYILPYLANRPQSLNRHPNGIKGKSFYQKDITGKAPNWIEKFPYYSEGDEQQKNFLVCNSEAALLYMASLGCIEMNPWSSTVLTPDYPDWCIIDLDPDKNSFEQVIDAALVTKSILDDLKVPSFCKTSGSTGLHIYIPLGAKYTYEQSKEFARVIARLVHEQLPGFTSIERSVSRRKGKMYIDFLQNRAQATISAPYSLRPKPGATVSMPLHWDEVKHGLSMKDFTIFNAMERIKSEGDIFKPVLGKGIDLSLVIKRFGN